MKKTFVLLLLSFSAYTIQAQVNFGVKAGANLTKFSGSDAKAEGISPSFKPGFAGGVFANYKFAENLGLQLEALYSLEGTTYKAEGEKMHFKTDYVNVPLLVQYNHESGFYAETGPQVGFLTSAKLAYDGNSVDMKEGFKKINFSWGLGAGYKLSNGLGIGARYNYGITSIADGQGESVNMKLGGFHLGLFYTFGSND